MEVRASHSSSEINLQNRNVFSVSGRGADMTSSITSSRPRAVGSSDTTRLNQHLLMMLSQHIYLDPILIYDSLVNELPHLKHIDQFRTIQFLHKDVTSAIDVYLYSNSICIYNELEKFILKVMNRKHKKKNRQFETFADIGLGMLHKHIRVIEFFGDLSSHISRLPDITILNVTQCIFKYYREGRRQSLIGRDPKMINHVFNIWLRNQIFPAGSQSAAQKPFGT